jgi:hypothetical protein
MIFIAGYVAGAIFVLWWYDPVIKEHPELKRRIAELSNKRCGYEYQDVIDAWRDGINGNPPSISPPM